MKKEILVVDDDLISQNILKIMLLDAGYSPIITPSGKEAIRLAQERSPSLIILDIMMPDMDGVEVANALKKDENTRDIPIIFLSVLIPEKKERRKRPQDEISILSKPFERERLLDEIRKYLAGPEI